MLGFVFFVDLFFICHQHEFSFLLCEVDLEKLLPNFNLLRVIEGKSLYFSSGDNCIATLTLGGAGAHATYYHKANDQVNK